MALDHGRSEMDEDERLASENALAWGLTKTADRMEAAQAEGTPTEQILDTVRLNWRLWTIIQTEQADPACETPLHIRAGLQDLGAFVNKRSIDILSNPQPRLLEVLVTINRNIAAGILGTDLPPEARAVRNGRTA